ncbi:MAG: SGNH/GDSL hydrolase family protein [Armatimonadetes bacterium]|nr:SGNH/GDSL hydrolase family protein [Armatimonadota bacterium]
MAQSSPSKTVRALAAGRVQLIACYGTSLTYGGAWVGQLDRELQRLFPCNVLMVNGGVGGMASPGGVNGLERRVLRTHPDCVFLEFGINDAYDGYKIPVETCRSNLVTMIDRILATNPECEIILMTMNPTLGKPKDVRPHLEDYYQVYRDVAKERGLLLVDHYTNWLTVLQTDRAAFDRFIPDGLHPGALGCSIVITPGILSALGLGGGFEESWKAYLGQAAETKTEGPKEGARQR